MADNPWSYRAAAHGHTYTLTAGVGDQPMWTTTVDHAEPSIHDTLDGAINNLLGHHGVVA